MSSPTPPPRPNPSRRYLIAGLTCIIAAGALLFMAPHSSDMGSEVTYSEMQDLITSNKVEKAELDDNILVLRAHEENGDTSWTSYPDGSAQEIVTALDKSGANVTVEKLSKPGLLDGILMGLVPVILIVGFLLFMMRKGGLGAGLGGMKLGKRGIPVSVPTTRFADVAGANEAVEELKEVVDFLHNPDQFTATGAKVPRGFLLVGPPGTGKTLLARAVAGEAGVPFFALTGSDFVETFVGLGAARVRELFAKAREMEKAIIFIDEIDAVGKARAQGPATGANDERENTLNQLLVEMDGFSRTPGLVMIAATNRPDVLDPALLRPGRFDRQIVVPAPDRGGRQRILELYAADRPFDDGIDWAAMSRRIPGMTGAEIEQMLNEASLEAARKKQTTISLEHVEAALATSVLGRERRSAIITERDKEIVAWHEAGHTVAALLEPHADAPVQVTIVPRGGAGGVTWMGGSEHDFLTRQQANARLVVAMAGRAAEEILLDGDHTQGAHGDLQSATALATEMITRYGMGSRLVSVDRDRIAFSGQEKLEMEISEMLTHALEKARRLLDANRGLLEAIVDGLYENETLGEDELKTLKDTHAGMPSMRDITPDKERAQEDPHTALKAMVIEVPDEDEPRTTL